MALKIFLACDNSFLNKARYVFRTLGDILGEKCRFVKAEECSNSDIVVCYGRLEDIHHIPGNHVIISANESSWDTYRRGRYYDHENAVKCSIDGEPSVALFYDREFEMNPGRFVSAVSREIIIHIDIVASAFYFLSGWQEYTSDLHDMHRRFPARASIQNSYDLFESPVVEHYAALLASSLAQYGWEEPFVGRYRNKLFAVMMTHDIDHLKKWTAGMIYRETFQYLLRNTLNKTFSSRLHRFLNFLKTISKKYDPYRFSLERILELEAQYNTHGTFFFLPNGKDRRDGKYSFRSAYVQTLFERLKNGKHEIGLHPTYFAYDQLELMRSERDELAEASGLKPAAVREHFLRFQIPKTWAIHEVLEFQYDATLGFAEHEGFRMGICHPYHAYDIEMDSPLKLWEIPLLVMDDTLKSYRNLRPDEAFKQIEKLLITVRKYAGVAVLLFHNSCYDEFDFPGWGKMFEKTMKWCYENDATMLNGKELLSFYPMND